MSSTVLIWLRRDLRLTDNPAFAAARGSLPIPVYIHAPDEEAPWQPGAATRWWLHHSLAALDADLRRRGSRLTLRQGSSIENLLDLCRASGATTVYANRLHEPAARARDTEAVRSLRAAGITLHLHDGGLLFAPEALRNRSGGPFRVFTPYWHACLAQPPADPPAPAPRRLPLPPELPGLPLDALRLLPRVRWDQGLTAAWRPGEAGALERLARFTDTALGRYAGDRDHPAVEGTSRLSPHLHFGELGPRQIWAALHGGPDAASAEPFLRQLIWREFAHHLLVHFPETPERPLDRRFERFAWREDGAALLAAWQRGQTGIPLVDAGMRQLWHEGWMHNRVRMVAASYLTKHLRVPWQSGARWFWETLVDADLANNTLGWQWVAGCGADAAPYFRVFNPALQGEKFDAAGAYVRRWCPELARLPDKFVHRPWALPAKHAAALRFVPGRDYPPPLVDLDRGREEALDAFRRLGR